MTDSPRVVVRGEAVVEVAPDTADVSTDAVAVFRTAAFTASAGAAPQLELQPAPQEVRGQVEVTLIMSEPDEEVFVR